VPLSLWSFVLTLAQGMYRLGILLLDLLARIQVAGMDARR
jgi:hypothetical protein